MVDNGSTDGSAECAEALGARVLRLARNYGFSHAVNVGIKEARTEYIAVLNNDVQPEEDWLAALAGAMENANPPVWFATGKLLETTNRGILDGCFDLLSRGSTAWRAGNGKPDGPLWAKQRRVACSSLTASLFRAELFEKIGLLDESFESYLEDVDLGFRCAMQGLEGLYVPEARAFHQGSATLGRWNEQTVRRIARNQVFLVARYYPPGWVLSFGWPVLVAQLLWGLLAFRHGSGMAWLKGKWEGIRRYNAVRGAATEPGRLREVLERQETEIKLLQAQSGRDWYWRCYFALT